MSNCNEKIEQKYKTALQQEYNTLGLDQQHITLLLDWFPKNPYPIPESVLSYQQNLALTQKAKNISTSSCDTPCKPNRMGAGRYYGSAANCKNDGTQGSCYMYSYPDPRGPMPSTNMLAPVGPKSRRFAKNFIPQKANANGLRLLFDNNKFTLTGSSVGRVGTSAASSRAIQRGRASARNATRLSYINK